MRLVCHLNDNDLTSLREGKVIMLSLVGMQGITLHFDPDPVADFPAVVPSRTIVPIENKEEKKLPAPETFQCDHCGKLYGTKSSLSRHRDWIKRKLDKKTLEEKVYGTPSNGTVPSDKVVG